jgi:hypothetical protein
MPSHVNKELVAVYQVTPGEARRSFSFHEDPIEYLPADAPLPRLGDVLLLPYASGRMGDASSAWAGAVAPFVVLEVEHVYHRGSHKDLDLVNPRPAKFVRIIINVRRLTDAEYLESPGGAGG